MFWLHAVCFCSLIHPSVHPFIYLFISSIPSIHKPLIYLTVHSFINITTHPSSNLFTHLFIHLSIYSSFHSCWPFIHPSIHPSNHLSSCQFIHPAMYTSIHLSMYTCTCISIHLQKVNHLSLKVGGTSILCIHQPWVTKRERVYHNNHSDITVLKSMV